MPTLQVQAKALGDPTRHGIFRYIADAQAPVDLHELSEQFAFNHNAIRQHLAKLVDAELIIESQAAPNGRGRPRLIYELDPTAESCWGVAGPFERLAAMLSEIIRTGATPFEVGRRNGLRRAVGNPGDREPAEVLSEEMARNGFDPALRVRGEHTEITLRHCPFESTALADPDTVCNLHLGLAHGMADKIGELAVDDLIFRDPRRANCRLICHRTGS